MGSKSKSNQSSSSQNVSNNQGVSSGVNMNYGVNQSGNFGQNSAMGGGSSFNQSQQDVYGAQAPYLQDVYGQAQNAFNQGMSDVQGMRPEVQGRCSLRRSVGRWRGLRQPDGWRLRLRSGWQDRPQHLHGRDEGSDSQRRQRTPSAEPRLS